jgi:hypothetical protein
MGPARAFNLDPPMRSGEGQGLPSGQGLKEELDSGELLIRRWVVGADGENKQTIGTQKQPQVRTLGDSLSCYVPSPT